MLLSSDLPKHSQQRFHGLMNVSPVVVGSISAVCLLGMLALLRRMEEGAPPLRGVAFALTTATPSEIEALEGEKIEVDFLLENNSNQQVQVTRIVASCDCMQVLSPDRLPVVVQPGTDIHVSTVIEAQPTFLPVRLEVGTKTESAEGSNWYTSGVDFTCRPRYRTSPAAIVCGELLVQQEAHTQVVDIFQVSTPFTPCAVAKAICSPEDFISASIADREGVSNVPENYLYMTSLVIRVKPRAIGGVQQGEVQVLFDTGDSMRIPVSAIVREKSVK